MIIPSTAQITALSETTWQHISDLVERTIKGSVFPSAALAIVFKGQWLLDAAWGWVDPEDRTTAVTPDTLFDLASVTKLFTMTAFLSALSEHQLELDTPLQSVIPEFGAGGLNEVVDGGQDPHSRQPLPAEPGMQGMTVDPAAVTFRHLLTHTSGLAAWRAIYAEVGSTPPPPDQIDPLDRKTRWQRALAFLCKAQFVGQPGDKIRYSDIGLMLLGEAASHLRGMPGDLDIVIDQCVLRHMEPNRAFFNPMSQGVQRDSIVPTEYDAMWRKRRAWGEVHDENACGVGGVAGHAGLFANAGTVATLGEIWRADPGRFGVEKSLADASKQEQAVTDGIRKGLGWALKAADDSSAGDLMSLATYGHTGFTGTSLFIDPGRDLVIACLTNRVYPGRDKPGIHGFRRAIHDLIVREVN